MWIFVVLTLAVLAIALYDFFVSKAWHELTYAERDDQSAFLRERHRRANAIRKAYNRLMLVIVAVISALAVSALVANKTFGGSGSAIQPPKPYDTTQLTLEAPPLQPVETLPESYKLEGNAGIDSHAQNEQEAEDGADTPEDNRPNKSQNDNGRPTINNPTEQPGKTPSKTPTILRSPDDQALYDQSQRQLQEMRDRADARKKKEEQRKLDELRRKQEGNKQTNDPTKVTSKSGTADVDWNHSWRKAFQNNDDNVRTPKYTCPSGVAGKVTIKVKVNSNGNVISATAVSGGVDGCLVEQALLYARTKTRFEVSSKEIDEGTLVYTFYP